MTDVINGKPVWGPPKDIKEVQNAWHADNEMPGYAPWSVDDLLRAHAHLLDTLIGESGQFRSGGVAVVGSDGTQDSHAGAQVDCRSFIDFMRHLKLLREQCRIQRVGSDKAGHWEVVQC